MNPYMNYGYGAQNPFVQQNTYNVPRQEVVRVHGRNGADAFNLPPNSSALLLDEQEPIVYLKTADGAGYATVTAYKIEPYVPDNNIGNMTDLEKRIERLERIYESNITNVSSEEQHNKPRGKSEKRESGSGI